MAKSKRRQLREGYAWPGGYPLFGLAVQKDGHDKAEYVMCPKCAGKRDWLDHRIIAVDANWEDPLLFCDFCNERIESAYAEDGDGPHS